MDLLLLGLPGAGKGTHAEILSRGYDLTLVSSGKLFRNAARKKTPLGEIAKRYILEGKLVPDEIAVKLIKAEIIKFSEKNLLFEGFPRTLNQAKKLDEILASIDKKLDLAIYLQVAEDNLVYRLSGRRVCSNDGSVYHVKFNRPQEEGICDECGGSLHQPLDDKEEIIENRIKENRKKTKKLIKYYREQGILKTVIGTDKEPDQVHEEIVDIIENLLEKSRERI